MKPDLSCAVTHLVRLTGIEPAHTASEADALSAELQAHKNFCNLLKLYQIILKFSSVYGII